MRRFTSSSVFPFLLWLLLSGPGLLNAQERSYEEMRAEVVDLYGEDRFAEAAEILTQALELYPDHLMANCVNLALMNLRLGKLAESPVWWSPAWRWFFLRATIRDGATLSSWPYTEEGRRWTSSCPTGPPRP